MSDPTLARAARVGDPVGHAPSELWGTIGAVVGIAAATAFVVFTGGVGGAVFAAGSSIFMGLGVSAEIASGLAVLGFVSVSGAVGRGAGEAGAAQAGKISIDGAILDGARTVSIGPGAKRAALADPICRVSCHAGAYVKQGSATVLIENHWASRQHDGTSCDGEIADGDTTVSFGGERMGGAGTEVHSLAYRITGYGLDLGAFAGGAPFGAPDFLVNLWLASGATLAYARVTHNDRLAVVADLMAGGVPFGSLAHAGVLHEAATALDRANLRAGAALFGMDWWNLPTEPAGGTGHE